MTHYCKERSRSIPMDKDKCSLCTENTNQRHGCLDTCKTPDGRGWECYPSCKCSCHTTKAAPAQPSWEEEATILLLYSAAIRHSANAVPASIKDEMREILAAYAAHREQLRERQ